MKMSSMVKIVLAAVCIYVICCDVTAARRSSSKQSRSVARRRGGLRQKGDDGGINSTNEEATSSLSPGDVTSDVSAMRRGGKKRRNNKNNNKRRNKKQQRRRQRRLRKADRRALAARARMRTLIESGVDSLADSDDHAQFAPNPASSAGGNGIAFPVPAPVELEHRNGEERRRGAGGLQAPDFMMNLYRRYVQEQSAMATRSRQDGNTVRSFYAFSGEDGGNHRATATAHSRPIVISPVVASDAWPSPAAGDSPAAASPAQMMQVYAFNVSAIPAHEQVVRAELRLERHPVALGDAATSVDDEWTISTGVYKMERGGGGAANNGSENVRYRNVIAPIRINGSSSLHWTDTRLRRLIAAARLPAHLLVVKFATTSRQRARRSVDDDDDELPSRFVIAVAERAKRDSRDTRATTAPTSSSVDSYPILIVYCNDSRTIVPTSPQEAASAIVGDRDGAVGSGKRARRSSPSSASNELPDVRFGATVAAMTSSTTARQNLHTELGGGKQRQVDRLAMHSLRDRNSARRDSRKSRKSRECRRKSARKSRRCRQQAKAATAQPATPAPVSANSIDPAVTGMCSRRSQYVSFDDIGWSEWIIAPHGYEMFYCAGTCGVESVGRVEATNHAIIQSFIELFRVYPHVPPACCVPERLAPLSMLFFDHSDHVVLKVYPNMLVDACGCR